MKLVHKIPLLIGGALVLAALAGFGGIRLLSGAAERLAEVVQADIARERDLQGVQLAFKTQVQEWKNTLLRGKDPAQREKFWKAFQAREAEVATRAARLADSLPAGEARKLMQDFVAAHASMAAGYRKGYEAFTSAGFDTAAGDAAVKGVDRAPSELLEQAARSVGATVAADIDRAIAEGRTAYAVSGGLMLAVVLGGIVGAVWVSRRITAPIEQAVQVARTVADGDLGSRIVAGGQDETGELMRALGAMNTSLVGIVASVREASQSIATGSAQIATGNADLSQRTEQQASRLQQTASSMEQLTTTVQHNADTADRARRMAGEASQAARAGGEMVGRVVATMHDIAVSSRRIGDIIATIDGIAFQTNILALNAAVEAARAGEQGRGFAVVAAEVRGLAQRSGEAAREIRHLIQASVGQVEAGSQLVGETGQSMEALVGQVNRVSELIDEISTASREQTQGIGQVSGAVQQLDQMTQSNAALVEQSAAAADSLSRQAAKLTELVGVFRLQGS